jgi:hypothetical protein
MRGSVALPCSPLRALHARADGDLRTLRAPSARTASLHQGELCWRLGRPGGQAGGGRAGGAAQRRRGRAAPDAAGGGAGGGAGGEQPARGGEGQGGARQG